MNTVSPKMIEAGTEAAWKGFEVNAQPEEVSAIYTAMLNARDPYEASEGQIEAGYCELLAYIDVGDPSDHPATGEMLEKIFRVMLKHHEASEVDVERVARALRDVEWGEAGSWEDADAGDRHYWVKSARAAITALIQSEGGVK